jgi:type I restriction enzyme S subunit
VAAIVYKPLKELVTIHYGSALKALDRDENGPYPVYGSSGLIGYHNARIVNFPTLIIGRKGSAGSVTYAPEGGWPIDTTFYISVHEPEHLDLRYLYYSLIHSNLEQHAITTSIPGINRSDLYQTKILVPPLPEQKRVVAILDQAEALRSKRRESIGLLDEFQRALFMEMIGGPAWNEMGWEIHELHDLADQITDGVHAKPEYQASGIPFISVKDVSGGVLSFDHCKYISPADHTRYIQRCHPEYLDILYTKVGTYGIPALVDTHREFSLYVSVALIKPKKDKVNPVFLKEMLAGPIVKQQADKAIKGIGVPDLHLVEIKQFKIPLPPMQVQNDFAAKTEKIQAQRNNFKQSLHDMNQMFNSLVQKMFQAEN